MGCVQCQFNFFVWMFQLFVVQLLQYSLVSAIYRWKSRLQILIESLEVVIRGLCDDWLMNADRCAVRLSELDVLEDMAVKLQHRKLAVLEDREGCSKSVPHLPLQSWVKEVSRESLGRDKECHCGLCQRRGEAVRGESDVWPAWSQETDSWLPLFANIAPLDLCLRRLPVSVLPRDCWRGD